MKTAAYKHEMTLKDHVRLARRLHAVKGMVIISGYPSPIYDRLYEGWTRVETTARIEGAQTRTECLWINPRAMERLGELPDNRRTVLRLPL